MKIDNTKTKHEPYSAYFNGDLLRQLHKKNGESCSLADVKTYPGAYLGIDFVVSLLTSVSYFLNFLTPGSLSGNIPVQQSYGTVLCAVITRIKHR